MKIAYLTWHDPRDVRHWSGTHSFMFDALTRHAGEVIPIGPFATPAPYRALELLLNAWHRGPAAQSPRKYRLGYSLLAAAAYGRVARRRLVTTACDVVFAPAAAREAIFSCGRTPFVFLNDAIFSQVVAFYPRFMNHARLTLWEAEQTERLCVRRAAAAIFSSRWASDAAAARYEVCSEKLHAIPFGANLQNAPASIIPKSLPVDRPLRLLLVGKEWLRKGIDTALEAVRIARERGCDITLTVLGCKDAPAVDKPPWLRMIPWLSKADASGNHAYRDLLLESDLFILPARAECWGIVLNEAAAFGIPALASDSGGIPELVVDGVSGFIHPVSGAPQVYADSIVRLMKSPALFTQLSAGARREFDTRLNWDAWARCATAVLETAASKSAHPTA